MRHWSNSRSDDDSIHCIGNGSICVYEKGPDIIQVFGAPYSLPSVLNISITDNKTIEACSDREEGSSIWRHTLSSDKKNGTFIDLPYGANACFIRKIDLEFPLELTLQFNGNSVSAIQNQKMFKQSSLSGAALFTVKAGTPFYSNLYCFPTEVFYQIVLQGNAKLEAKDSDKYTIRLDPGESLIAICGGEELPECVETARDVLNCSYSKILQDAKRFYREWAAQSLDFNSLIPDSFKDKSNLIKSIDDITYLICSQTDKSGGIIAGHNYHLAYVRDQYGVARCLLKLGLYDHAKAILAYYFGLWEKYGKISNAQSPGLDGVFHRHENDKSEITGYLIIQAFDYWDASGDTDFLKHILPMLKWALQSQIEYLAGGMLPFNGDETYVAGGMLPRSVLNDGSAEATLLFITGGRRLLNFIGKFDDWSKQQELVKIVEETANTYLINFVKDSRLITNNPKRKSLTELPDCRHGVCESCSAFGWTFRSENDRYLCMTCFEKACLPKAEDKEYFLLSTALITIFVHADLIPKDIICQMIDKMIQSYWHSGKLPSSQNNDLSVGYDYGLFLNALVYLKHPLADEIYSKMINLIDNTGAWVEYYLNGKPCSTRCRPWESGINLTAAIEFALDKG
jgi:hypothetical protein